MTCHSQVWRDAPVLAPVRKSWATGKPLRWKRVNDLPDHVYFNHSIHVQKGVACVSCHGHVERMPLMQKAHSLYMRWCLDCHRAPERAIGSRNEVFAVENFEGGRLAALGEGKGERIPLFAVHETKGRQARLEDCSICHR